MIKNKRKDLIKECKCPLIFKKAPIIIYVLYDSRFTYTRFANIQSGAAAIQNMLLCSESLGLGALWVADYGEEAQVRKVLNIPKEMEIIAAVIIGYPDESPAPPYRPQLSEILCYESFDVPPYPLSLKVTDWPLRSIVKLASNSIRLTAPHNKSAFRPVSKRQFEQELAFYQKKISPLDDFQKRVLILHSINGNIIVEIEKIIKSSEIVDVEFSSIIIEWIKARAEILLQRSLKKTKKHYISTTLELPFKDNTFDIIICSTVLNRVPSPLVLLREMKRVSKQNGQLFISVFNSTSIEGLHRKITKNYIDQFTPLTLFSLTRIQKMLNDVGLIQKDTIGINLFPSLERITRVISNPIHFYLVRGFTHFLGNMEGYRSRGILKRYHNLLIFQCIKF